MRNESFTTKCHGFPPSQPHTRPRLLQPMKRARDGLWNDRPGRTSGRKTPLSYFERIAIPNPSYKRDRKKFRPYSEWGELPPFRSKCKAGRIADFLKRA